MTAIVLQILLTVVGLGASIFAWWIKQDADKKKKVSDEDKKIDDAVTSDDLLREFDKLRHK